MKTILRNLFYTLKRFRTASVLNLLGLSTAFAAFILIMMKVSYEYNFDTCYPDSGRIAVLNLSVDHHPNELIVLPRPFVEGVIEETPAIECGAFFDCSPNYAELISTDAKQPQYIYEPVTVVSPDFARTLGMAFITGNDAGLRQPGGAIISESQVRKLFPKGNAVGSYLYMPENKKLLITGVYKDFPENSQFKNVIYEANPWIFYKVGDRQHTWLLITIAILTISIAAINLINFSTALTPMRIRSINTQKVLGSPVKQLRIGLVSETIAIVLIGWLLSLFIVWILTHMKLLSLIGFTPSFFTYLPVILISGGIALLTGIIAGLYPAWYMTSFPPALMLKGNYALSAKGRLFRTLLTSFQYIISFALLVCATFIWQQNQYMKIQDTRFARDEIVIAGLPHKGQELSQFTTFKHELEKFPEFKGTAYVSTKLGASDVYSMTGSKYEGEEFYHYEIRVSPDFGEVMGFKLLEGRFFLASDTISSNKYTYCLGTKRIKDEQHIPTDTPFRGNHSKSNYIVGYIDDVIFTSSRVNAFAYSPFLFTVESQLTKLPYAYIRIKAGSDVPTALRHIHETAEKIFPGYPVEVNFFNTYYQQLYEKETNQQYMVTLFSLLAIIISLVGVFGLTIFETAYRRKEIGIRKVYGAKTSDILWNFNRTYLRIITICSIIASPFAWFFMDKWLQNFIIRINLSPWVFLIAFAIIIILTLTIVTIQNYRAATSNPTENLKIE